MFPNAARSAARRALPLAFSLLATTLADAQTVGADFAVGDASKLLISGCANTVNGAVYAIEATRDANNHITGFVGSGASVSSVDSEARPSDGLEYFVGV